jgi:hypothetical protein
MAWYREDDEIRNLHRIKKEIFSLAFRAPEDNSERDDARMIEAARVYAQLARLQAELEGRLTPLAVAVASSST